MALNRISLLHHLKKGVRSLLRFFKKRSWGTEQTELLNMGQGLEAQTCQQNTPVLMLLLKESFGASLCISAMLASVQNTSYFFLLRENQGKLSWFKPFRKYGFWVQLCDLQQTTQPFWALCLLFYQSVCLPNYTIHILAHCSFTSTSIYFSAFDAQNNPVRGNKGAILLIFIRVEIEAQKLSGTSLIVARNQQK